MCIYISIAASVYSPTTRNFRLRMFISRYDSSFWNPFVGNLWPLFDGDHVRKIHWLELHPFSVNCCGSSFMDVQLLFWLVCFITLWNFVFSVFSLLIWIFVYRLKNGFYTQSSIILPSQQGVSRLHVTKLMYLSFDSLGL